MNENPNLIPDRMEKSRKNGWIYGGQIVGSGIYGIIHALIINIVEKSSGIEETEPTATYPYVNIVPMGSSMYFLGGLIIFGGINSLLTRNIIFLQKQNKKWIWASFIGIFLFIISSILYMASFLAARIPHFNTILPGSVRYSVFLQKR